MKVTFLGTGTSHGIPVVGCSCPVCRSEDPRNNRMRCSVRIETDSTSVVIDTTPEFRLQAVRAGLDRLDAVLFTHAHADHIHGLDDIRPFSYHTPLPVFGNTQTLEELQDRFSYIFRPTQQGGGKPRIELNVVDDAPFTVGDLEIRPLPVLHGALPILGYRAGSFAYITDCSSLPDSTLDLIRGVDTLVLNALRYRSHPTHFSIDEAIAVISAVAPERAFLTHFCHDVDHEALCRDLETRHHDGIIDLPILPAYDGLQLNLPA